MIYSLRPHCSILLIFACGEPIKVYKRFMSKSCFDFSDQDYFSPKNEDHPWLLEFDHQRE